LQRKSCLIGILGPTATGKSRLALRAASILNGEIVNCDSLQLHRLLNIGTAKPSVEERQQIPHHLYDVLDPDQYFSARMYMVRAREICKEIASRGKIPIVVGGTGLYFKVFLEGIFEGPGRSESIRNRLHEVARKKGKKYLYNLLRKKDIEIAERIKEGDLVRIIRALEIYFTTGKRISDLQAKKVPLEGFNILRIGIKLPRSILYDRINRRVAKMFDMGLVEETRNILEIGYSSNCKGFEALGYRQAMAVLKGELALDVAVELTQRDTRRYAKRQMTWFRGQPKIDWIVGPGDDQLALDGLLQLVRWGCEEN